MEKKIKVGSEIDSYCGKCKLVLNHVVIAMVETDPRRVRCLTCNSDHNHRLPKPKTSTKKASRSASESKSKSKSTGTSSRAAAAIAAKWNDAISGWDDAQVQNYSIYGTFRVSDQIVHTKFGKGVVTDIPAPDRMVALFETGEKLLMQGKVSKA